MKYITPSTVATPKGHYSPGIVHNGIVYVAGQLALDEAGEVHKESVEAETIQCMKNVEAVLHAAGSDLQHILKVNIYIADIALWPRVNATYAAIMGDHKPARVTIPCNQLNYGCSVEIDCIAAVR